MMKSMPFLNHGKKPWKQDVNLTHIAQHVFSIQNVTV